MIDDSSCFYQVAGIPPESYKISKMLGSGGWVAYVSVGLGLGSSVQGCVFVYISG